MNSDGYEYIQLLEAEQALEPYKQLRQGLPFSYDKDGIEEIAIVKQPEWIAVPVESNGHFDLEFQVRLQQTISEQGSQNIFAILIETPETEPVAYKIPNTREGIAEFNLVCGALNCALFTQELNWVIICTVDDYYIVAGQEPLVFQLLLANQDRAFAEFEVYVKNINWPEPIGDRVKKHLSCVQSVLNDYKHLQTGSSVNLPLI
jgi:hypothetical protein